jgi:dimethylglycine dehydrogenase
MCGFDRFIDYEKADFIGREAALADREAEHEQRLVGLEIKTSDADAWGYEPVWYQDELAGFVTSGAYGHTVEKSLALAYVKTQFLDSSNDDFSVHVLDKRRPAKLLAEAPYDPSGSRMRG